MISPFTRRGTVVRDTFHSCAVLRTLRDRFDLGPALTRRDAAAPSLDVAFNSPEPRTDALHEVEVPDISGIDHTRGEELGDAPDVKLLMHQRAEASRQRISQLGHATLRNAARRTGEDLEQLPDTLDEARSWMANRFSFHDAANT